jgi:hypothetical protein
MLKSHVKRGGTACRALFYSIVLTAHAYLILKMLDFADAIHYDYINNRSNT